MHEMPAGKIGLYTGFFDFANFRLPFSTFLVDVEDFACPASFPWHTAKHVTKDRAPMAADLNAQDYATLVAHPSPFRKFSEAFPCLVGLSRRYNLDEETYPRFLHKNEEEMVIFAFIHTSDPTKLRIVERERNEGEARLLDTTVGRTVSLLLVFLDRADNELEASVERLFDEGGSGNQTKQGDSAGGERNANIQPVVEAADATIENVAPVQSRRQGKRKFVIVDAGGASHPPKKLRKDHGTPSGTFVGSKSRSALQRLLAGAVLNAKVGVAAIPTLPFVTASVSTTPEREGVDHVDSVTEPNLHTIGAPQMFVISSNSSHHSGTNVAETDVDSLVRSSVPIMTTATTLTPTADPTSVAKEKLVEPSPFGAGSSLAGGADPTTGVFLYLNGSDFLVGTIHTVINPDTGLQKVYIPQWSMTNGSHLDDGHLFIEFNVRAACQMSLSDEVRIRTEYNVKEKRRLKSVVESQAKAVEAIRLHAEASNFKIVEKSLRDEKNSLRELHVILEKEQNALDVKVTELETSAKSKERKVTDLNALVTAVKSQNDNLTNRVHELEISSFELQEKITVYENCMDQLEKFQDDRMRVVNDKFDKLYVDFVEMALHMDEKFYPHLLITISGRRWLLTLGMKLAIANYLNSLEYLYALGTAIGKAIKKGMQDGLAVGITHDKEGRVLADVAAYNPFVEADYIFALQQLQKVNFSLLARLKSNKDASVETVMDILRLEGPLAEKLWLNELQPHINQLMVPIHSSPDKVVVGAIALSLALDVSSVSVQKIRENIANHRSTLRDFFVPLAEPLSAAVFQN
nr:hypothetical protein [Tanacetum cinerariifolium]